MRLLAKDPADRPPSAEAAARALEAIERDAAGPQGEGGCRQPARRRSSLVVAATVLLLVSGPSGSRLEPARPAPAPAPLGSDAQDTGRSPIVPAAFAVERRTDTSAPGKEEMALRQVELAGVIRDVEQQRDAVALEVLDAQAELEALDARLGAQPVPQGPAAVEADAEVQALRAQIAKTRAVLDDYRSRGLDLRRPTPQASARALADLHARLAQRVKKVDQDLRPAADNREALRQARAQLVSRIEALRRVHDGLQANLDRLHARTRGAGL
jgi:hypothetical protein